MKFTKMQGAGNDFIIIDNREGELDDRQLSHLARRLCRRRFSIGADGLMAVERPQGSGDFCMAFFNADGSKGEMCGNGARCIARYGYDHGLSAGKAMVETTAGLVEAERLSRDVYAVKLNTITKLCLDLQLSAAGRRFSCSYAELGDPGLPHLVVPYPGLRSAEAGRLRCEGSALRRHPQLPKGANVNFYDIEKDGTIFERTFERGVEDFTLACGTGTGCLAAVLHLQGRCRENPVEVETAGGMLSIEIKKEENRITELRLIGSAVTVAEGETVEG